MHLFTVINWFGSSHMLKQHAELPLRRLPEQQCLVNTCLRRFPAADYPTKRLLLAALPEGPCCRFLALLIHRIAPSLKLILD